MLPTFLRPESVARESGAGPEIEISAAPSKPLLVTLGITRTIEQESLEVSLWGSDDRTGWRRLAAFPQKFYCGTYSLLVDLSHHGNVRYLRAQWKMNRWGRGDLQPLFGFYLFAEESKLVAAAVG